MNQAHSQMNFQVQEENFFFDIICNFMFSMGAIPLEDTVKLLEETILEQLELILSKANEVASIRGSEKIDMDDFIFILRKDQVRLKRMYKFLTFSRSQYQVDDENMDYENFEETAKDEAHNKAKKFKSCINNLIDTKNGLISHEILDETSEVDTEKHHQLMRLDKQFEHLPTNQYIKLINQRTKAFKNLSRHKFHYLRDYIWSEQKHKPLTQVCNDILGFLFREILSQLIEISILIKKEREKQKECFSLIMRDVSYKQNPVSNLHDHHLTLYANEIIEALRRCHLSEQTNILNMFNKNGKMHDERSKLLFFK